jgi:cardiolipin synthase A/B
MTTTTETQTPPAIAAPSVEGRAVKRAAKRYARWRERRQRLERRRPPRKSRLGEAGTCRGACIDAGCVEAGWTAPPPVALAGGSALRLYKDGQGLTAALHAIKAARHEILLEVYVFHSDETGRAFAAALAAKAREGVRVFVMYDSFGSVDSDPAMFAMMRQAGVHLAEFHPLKPWECKFTYRPFNRDHRKLLVVDNQIAGLGGLNVGAEYGSGFLSPRARRCDLWRDNGIGIVGPAAEHFAQCFARTWHYVQHGGKMSSAQMIHNVDLGPVRRVPTVRPARRKQRRMQTRPGVAIDGARPRLLGDFGILASVPTPTSPLVPCLLSFLRGARSSLDLTIAYFAPSDALIAELLRAARRGVHVRLMLPGQCDVKLVRFAARSFYEELLKAGVEVWERQGAVLHAKTMVVDEQTTVIGSLNLDYRSIEYNCELSAVIRNPDFGRQMTALFQHDTEYAQRITPGKWRRRPWRDRFVQWAASRARYLL